MSGNARKERGATLVEFAFVFVPLLAMMLAIVDFAMPMLVRNTFSHAVREGARYGITFQTDPGRSHSESIRQVVQRNAMGFLDGDRGLERIKVRWYRSTPPFDEVTSGVERNADGNIVEVAVENYRWNWIVPLWRNADPINITVISADRLETLRRGAARPAP